MAQTTAADGSAAEVAQVAQVGGPRSPRRGLACALVTADDRLAKACGPECAIEAVRA